MSTVDMRSTRSVALLALLRTPLEALTTWLHRPSSPYPGNLTAPEELAAMRAQREWRTRR